MMNRIQKKSLAQEVAEALQYSIERGAFAINEKLPTEPELMQKFNVGRSTIREAIKYLAQSGFVKVQQGLGTFVISSNSNSALDDKIERADFADIFEVRQLIELKTVEKAASNRSSAQLDKMKKQLAKRQKYAQSGDTLNCIQADVDFHILVAESCGNAILDQLYKTMSVHVIKFFSNMYKDTSTFIESQDIHERLLKAIEDKDVTSATQIATKIIGKL
ncbi:FadR/GntR family transcriptional regulator [Sphingobacterium paucimobilis]|uniref:FadR/GntR family transcriptional regulator n=1 Tax=Sphingobacterium paucimobilis TaxID=1385985 RepID=UPI0003B2E684|nr:FadR/GntR family transcriptional regulator [Sphingobacterium paucimobilis]